MPRKLKVYRTPIGFHDAYVAAASQKAALEAWGADANLFARGVAEEVTDPALMEEPLAEPGKVIRKVRGTMSEHMAALPPTPKPRPRRIPDESGPQRPRPAPKAKRKPAPKPRPSRDKIEQAEAALEEAERRHTDARRELTAWEAALARERKTLNREHEREMDRLEAERVAAEREYQRALADWQNA